MALASVGAKEDQGTWFFHSNDPDTKQPVSLRIRRIPGGEERRILGRIQTLNIKRQRKSALLRVDVEVEAEKHAAKAAWAWTDSKNLTLRVGKDAAPFFSEQLGRQVAAGDEISLDGTLPEELKVYVLLDVAGLTAFILEQVRSLDAEAAEEEDELSKT